jgi:hypothetical protein
MVVPGAVESAKRVVFPAGKRRFVCVNRLAIVENLRRSRNHPTVIVVEDGKESQFHAAQCNGLLRFAPLVEEAKAPVHVATDEEIIAYEFPEADGPFIPEGFQVRWSRRLSAMLDAFLGSPIVSCFTGRK